MILTCNNANNQSKKVDNINNNTLTLTDSINENNGEITEYVYLEEKVIPIQENFTRINSIKKWNKIITEERHKSTEGGEINYYYHDNTLEIFAIKEFGETYQKIYEYYLQRKELSFLFTKEYRYNRPIYYDQNKMIENKDNEHFDIEKSEIIEDRYYFENGKLIHIVSNQDSGGPFADYILKEEGERIIDEFNKIIKNK